ncbi:MAG: hypothetical protein HYX53_01525 [Chloroflexi bacterium]|nr:hypothetical protein [Chloroflexota bacterium]
MKLELEVEGAPAAVGLPGDGAALVAFMSFAVSRGFGATHPLIALADRLHDVHRVGFGPLTTFYEARPEDSEDREKLERAWQAAGPLRESLGRVAAAMETDEMAATLARRGGAESLAAEARALAELLEGPNGAGQRVRLVYEL